MASPLSPEEAVKHTIRCFAASRVNHKHLVTARKWASDPESHMCKFYQNNGYLGTEAFDYDVLVNEVEGVTRLNSPHVDANREALVDLYKVAVSLRNIVVAVNQIEPAILLLRREKVEDRDIHSIVKNMIFLY